MNALRPFPPTEAHADAVLVYPVAFGIRLKVPDVRVGGTIEDGGRKDFPKGVSPIGLQSHFEQNEGVDATRVVLRVREVMRYDARPERGSQPQRFACAEQPQRRSEAPSIETIVVRIRGTSGLRRVFAATLDVKRSR
ncbi:MAG TPA: hypothetical protein VIV60_19290, partial [Polyangiaceae bacterium]